VITIREIALPLDEIESLREEARSEGYNFVETLVEEWASGENRFEKKGEVLMGCFEELPLEQAQLVAVGGVTIDPFLHSPEVGRIRRVYVRAAWRNQGIGALLVKTLIAASAKNFRAVRLRAENGDAARLYERLGFSPIEDKSATHLLTFDSAAVDSDITPA
jgi:predicted GNAT family acetyltransferase